MKKTKSLAPSKIFEDKYNFTTVFRQTCMDNLSQVTPIGMVLSAPFRPGAEIKCHPSQSSLVPNQEYYTYYVQNNNFERDGKLNTLIFRNVKLDLIDINALQDTIDIFNTLSTLRLNNCNLSHQQLFIIHCIVKHHATITDLNLDENPNDRQNFYLFFKKNNLQYLSLQRCKINDRGMQLIANELEANTTIVSLDLSTNALNDLGSGSLARALRINRTLNSLILTDNWITDQGVEVLMQVLREFELTQDEIELRRKLNFEYEFQKLRLQKQFSSEKIKSRWSSWSADAQLHKKRTSVPTKESSISIKTQRTNGSKTSYSYTEQLEEFLRMNVRRTGHPYETECKGENGSLYCNGNFKIVYINLSYNKISLVGLQHILETVVYQFEKIPQQGLTNIVLNGNESVGSQLMIDIKSVLQDKMIRSKLIGRQKRLSSNKSAI